MAHSEPRRYLQFILNEWPLIDSIYERTRQRPLRPQALRELAKLGESPRVVDRLLEFGILVPLPNSPAYEMGDLIQTLLAQLKQEHALGLANEIKVYLEDLRDQTAGIVEALENPDHDKLVRHAEALQNRIKAIHRQLVNNGQALAEIVERAKTRQRSTTLRQRYAEVLEAWDRYVEPVREMVDPAGPFEALFERLERELKLALQAILTHGGLVRERLRLELLLFRLMHLRGELRRHLGEATELLLPVVREIRRNSVVARGAAVALQRLRKRELDGAALAALVPVCRRPTPAVAAGQEHLEAYLADLGSYCPAPQAFVVPAALDSRRPAPFDLEAAIAAVRQAGRIDDLLAWLVDSFGDQAEIDDLLELFFRILGRRAGFAVASGGRRRYETTTHYITAPSVAVQVNPEHSA